MEHYVYHNLSRVFLFLAYFVNHVLVNRQLCRPDSSSLYDHNSSPASYSVLLTAFTIHHADLPREAVCLSV